MSSNFWSNISLYSLVEECMVAWRINCTEYLMNMKRKITKSQKFTIYVSGRKKQT